MVIELWNEIVEVLGSISTVWNILITVLVAATLLCVVVYWRASLWRHIQRHPYIYTIGMPLLLVGGMFGGFYSFAADPGNGTFGDSFGVLTSLFTGLGFAGLTITLVIQQWQISVQKQDTQNAKDEANFARYDLTLHQLLDLYKKSVDCVVVRHCVSGGKIEGLDGIEHAYKWMIDHLKVNSATRVPVDLSKRYDQGKLTDHDWSYLDHLFETNAELIKKTLNRQERVVNSFTLLLHHLEDRTPPRFRDIDYARMLVHSQLTNAEVAYFFYLVLGFNREKKLQRLMQSSGILRAFPIPCDLEVHRMMSIDIWDFDPKASATLSASASSQSFAKPGEFDVMVDDEGKGTLSAQVDA